MASPQANTSLNEDRETLLEIRDTLAGITSLNWSAGLPISKWEGVTVSKFGVTKLTLSKSNLTGTIPPELGRLSHLRTLNLRNNQLTGSIPIALGKLLNLEWMSFTTINCRALSLLHWANSPS